MSNEEINNHIMKRKTQKMHQKDWISKLDKFSQLIDGKKKDSKPKRIVCATFVEEKMIFFFLMK